MVETNIQEKLNTTVVPEVGKLSPEVASFSSETPSINITQPVVMPVSSVEKDIPIKTEVPVTKRKPIGKISVDSGTSWKNAIESKEQGVEPSEL